MAQITLNLDTTAALEQYAKKVCILLDEMKVNSEMKAYSGLEPELQNLQKAIYRARMLKSSVSMDIRFVERLEMAIIEYIEE